MPVTLSSIVTEHKRQPPRVVVYGPHGIGKTTFACSAVRPIVIRTEDGLGTLDVPAFPLAHDFGEVMDALIALQGEHKYRTAIVDSIDWLEPMIWAQVCRENNVANIESVGGGFGKGYVAAEGPWKRFLDALTSLRDRGMTVILIAHAEIKTFNAPDTEPYDRYQPKLHKRASALVQEWADVVGFAHYEVFTQKTETGFNKKVIRGAGTGNRILSVEERPAFVAKKKYDLPVEMPLDWVTFAAALRAAFAVKSTPNGNGTTASTEPTDQPSATEELVNA